MDQIENQTVRIKLKKFKTEEHKQDNRRHRIIIFILSIMIFVSFIAGSVISYKFLNYYPIYDNSELSKFKQAYNILKNEWYFSGDKDLTKELIDLAIMGMTDNEYDKHVYYYSSEQNQDVNEQMSGSFVGIGILFHVIDEEYMIEQVILNSPAKEAGLMPGDILYKIDGQKVLGKTSDELKEMVAGEVGTNVEVTILRNNEEVVYNIKRDIIHDSITPYEIDDNTVMLQISQFAASTGEEFVELLEYYKDKKNLIIDLRDNGGGYLGALTKMGEALLAKGKVIIGQQDRDGNISQIKAESDDDYIFDHIMIFVNGNSASASEAFTICLKENLDNVTIIGKTTYGKGTMQVPYYFSDGSTLNYTVAKWLSPNNNSIHEKGIVPDIEVELNEYYQVKAFDLKQDHVYDQVDDNIKIMQQMLRNLGYDIDRVDGYFSQKTVLALNKFKADKNLKIDGILDENTAKSLTSAYLRNSYENRFELDNNLKKAMEIIYE